MVQLSTAQTLLATEGAVKALNHEEEALDRVAGITSLSTHGTSDGDWRNSAMVTREEPVDSRRGLRTGEGPLESLLAAATVTTPADGRSKKIAADVEAAVASIQDGAVIMFGGFGRAGAPLALRDALARRGLRDLTIVCNNADFGALAEKHSIARLICSYPTGPTAGPVREQIESGEIELLITPQGTLVEQIRAAAAGLGGVLTPTGVGTEFAARFETVTLGGRDYLLAPALPADVALVKAAVADTRGNLACRRAARNFNPAMAMAARLTIAQVDCIVPAGDLDPDLVHIPGQFVDVVVAGPTTARPALEATG
jgi:3-oxoadipate CoA-transferase alpha subunit